MARTLDFLARVFASRSCCFAKRVCRYTRRLILCLCCASTGYEKKNRRTARKYLTHTVYKMYNRDSRI